MDILRIRSEVGVAVRTFPNVEVHSNGSGGVFVKAVLQTAVMSIYVITIQFPNYPNEMPKVFVTKPDLGLHGKHQYNAGNICYLHPSYWNPGRHDLTFVLGRTAKWLNKFEVWRVKKIWPGAEILHT